MTAKKPRGIVAQPPDIETPPESTTSRVSGQASVTSPAIGAPVSVEVSVESETASASTKNVRSARAFRGVGQAVTIQLPLMRPEAEVEIELRMDARNPYRSGSYHYWLVSHYEDEEEQPFILDPSQPARLVSIQRLPGWLLGLTVFLTFAVLLINTFWLAYLVQWFLIRFS